MEASSPVREYSSAPLPLADTGAPTLVPAAEFSTMLRVAVSDEKHGASLFTTSDHSGLHLVNLSCAFIRNL